MTADPGAAMRWLWAMVADSQPIGGLPPHPLVIDVATITFFQQQTHIHRPLGGVAVAVFGEVVMWGLPQSVGPVCLVG
jgi:hypothetical protein